MRAKEGLSCNKEDSVAGGMAGGGPEVVGTREDRGDQGTEITVE